MNDEVRRLVTSSHPLHGHMHNGISSHISATHSFHRLLHWNGASSRIDREVGDGQPKNDHLAQGLYYLKTHLTSSFDAEQKQHLPLLQSYQPRRPGLKASKEVGC